jgi:hypothetical protein
VLEAELTYHTYIGRSLQQGRPQPAGDELGPLGLASWTYTTQAKSQTVGWRSRFRIKIQKLACPTCEEQVLVACRKKSMVGVLGGPAPITIWFRRMVKNEAKGLDHEPLCVKCGSKMRFSCTEP